MSQSFEVYSIHFFFQRNRWAFLCLALKWKHFDCNRDKKNLISITFQIHVLQQENKPISGNIFQAFT
jgi:hypothetical protein